MVIQRSWKILSDAGSTSASSTEANRSPSLVNSSSEDDSDCSNQTTHSMVTSVASPTVAAPKVESVPVVEAPTAVQKFITTPLLAETMLQRLKQRLSLPVSGSGTTMESAMHSLELLRISVQQSFDAEIDAVVRKFSESYFKPALNNIKENLGQTAVSEDMVQKMSCALLENAKMQYNPFQAKSQEFNATYSSTIENVALKRAASKSNTGTLHEPPKKIFPTTTSSQASSVTAKSALTLAQPTLLQQTSSATVMPARRQIFWNTAHISTNTKFVLDVRANEAFGFGTDGKERLASKHPELIRYLPDSDDRDWLTAQNIIATQNRNSRFLFLIYDEVCRLQQTHEIYRNKASVDLNIMQDKTFTVPEFMIQKMKLFFVDLNIKSRGLITNSFSVVAATQSNSHLRNALLQGGQTVAVAASSTSSASSTTQSSNSVTTNASLLTSKPKLSTLSSSHATLTALLNNSNGGNEKS